MARKKQKIALLLPDLEGGGAQRVFLILARHFADRGHSVDLIIAHRCGPLLHDIDSRIKVYTVLDDNHNSSVPGLIGKTIQWLRQYLRNTPPDVLMSSITGTNLVAVFAWLISGKPCRLVLREANTRENTRSRFRRFLSTLLYPLADRYIAISTDVATSLPARSLLENTHVRVIHNPIDTELIRQLARKPAQHRFFKDHTRPVIVSAGRLSAQKDYPTLLKAFSLLDKPDARLVIYGVGPDETLLRKLARELGIEDRFDLPGWIDNTIPEFAAADLFVLSSRWEGFGQVLIEAIAAGTPVVATACPGGPREILEDGKCGGLAPPGDAAALANEIRHWLDNPPRAAALIDRADDFRVTVIGDAYLEFLLD